MRLSEVLDPLLVLLNDSQVGLSEATKASKISKKLLLFECTLCTV